MLECVCKCDAGKWELYFDFREFNLKNEESSLIKNLFDCFNKTIDRIIDIRLELKEIEKERIKKQVYEEFGYVPYHETD